MVKKVWKRSQTTPRRLSLNLTPFIIFKIFWVLLLKIFFPRTTVLFISSFLAPLGLHCCSQASSSCSNQGLLLSCDVQAAHAVSSLVADYGLWSAQPSVVVASRLQSAGSAVVVPGRDCSAACGVFPGTEPMSSALADGFLSTDLPGKSRT